eukprot:TRINITY_DN44849_c0_g6_i1.p7 TRINITY_DN44849_c0_g6~~TRINITY_DN44849_c0_g6_i1.p7  ORF type:complete len:106 (+),score=0.96 TRINITY_DN44849_c0_g6_i1:423-740(+)
MFRIFVQNLVISPTMLHSLLNIQIFNFLVVSKKKICILIQNQVEVKVAFFPFMVHIMVFIIEKTQIENKILFFCEIIVPKYFCLGGSITNFIMNTAVVFIAIIQI